MRKWEAEKQKMGSWEDEKVGAAFACIPLFLKRGSRDFDASFAIGNNQYAIPNPDGPELTFEY